MGKRFSMKRYWQVYTLIMACTLPLVLSTGGTAVAAETSGAKENLEKLIKTRSCKGCDLSGLTMNRLDLSGVDLEGSDLSTAKLSLTNLAGANLQNANLRGATLGGTDLSDADLRGADLRGTSLDNAYHQGAKFDGKFISAKSGEKGIDGGADKKIYIADPEKPKQSPVKREAKIVQDSGSEKASSKIAAVQEIKETNIAVTKPDAAPKGTVQQGSGALAQAPEAKKAAFFQKAVVDVPPDKADKTAATVPAPQELPGKSEAKKNAAAEPTVAASPKKSDDNSSRKADVKPVAAKTVDDKAVKDKSQGAAVNPPKSTKVSETKAASDKSAVKGGARETSKEVSPDKIKDDNLAKLLDKNRCFACDLSGLDLSGKDLAGADLEKSNLSGCNLGKANLKEANLKGAQLVKADLREANLKNADLYKADLTGADFTGAKVAGTMFDDAKRSSAVGLAEAIEAAGK
ncbi:MAG: pentapeptide repeat-containing protein [Desulforhopalus sp.]|nr:pentapeptide repeat-containing protein [Desulforhopalus sp.]